VVGANLLPSLQFLGLLFAVGTLLYLLYTGLGDKFLDKVAVLETARGLLTFLFAISTVGIAVIVVLAIFLGAGEKDDLGDRFQRGKDVLTTLIGVFGAIIGFYFGSVDQRATHSSAPAVPMPAQIPATITSPTSTSPAPPPPAPAQTPAATTSLPQSTQQLQQSLKNLGLYKGPTDGILARIMHGGWRA